MEFKLNKVIWCLVGFLFTNPVLSSQEKGKIHRFLINKTIPNAVILNVISTEEPTKPECVGGWEWVIDISTETGKAMYSLALSMYMADKEIVIAGMGTCDDSLYASGEVVRYIYPN